MWVSSATLPTASDFFLHIPQWKRQSPIFGLLRFIFTQFRFVARSHVTHIYWQTNSVAVLSSLYAFISEMNLKLLQKGKDEEEEVSSYWMTLWKRQDTGNRNRKHQFAHYGELAFEEAIDLT